MHAGFPYLQSMVALLHLHPNVHVGALQAPFAFQRGVLSVSTQMAAKGFAKRIMFGADFDFRQPSGTGYQLYPDGGFSEYGAESRHRTKPLAR
jgi:predicted TIM-barrel fold metal-dependent hydrolase